MSMAQRAVRNGLTDLTAVVEPLTPLPHGLWEGSCAACGATVLLGHASAWFFRRRPFCSAHRLREQ
jgi:hypothetical protein